MDTGKRDPKYCDDCDRSLGWATTKRCPSCEIKFQKKRADHWKLAAEFISPISSGCRPDDCVGAHDSDWCKFAFGLIKLAEDLDEKE